MIQIKGDLWDVVGGNIPAVTGKAIDFKGGFDAVCITTNGFIKHNGTNVMGRGCAAEAVKRYPDLPKILGESLKLIGNYPAILIDNIGDEKHPCSLVSFPVKPRVIFFDGSNVVSHISGQFKKGRSVPGWAAKADLELIIKSAVKLEEMATRKGWKSILIPRPGCGAGELKWEDVKPALDKILDDRFISITNEEE